MIQNRAAAFFLLSILFAGSAQGQSREDALHPYLRNKHFISVGALSQEAHAEIRETVDPLPRIAVNLGHLGVDETDTTYFLEYRGRLWDRWGIVASAQNFRSRGTIENGTEFNFDGFIYPVGAQLRTTLDVDTYIFDFVYQALRSDRGEVKLGLGIHAFEFDADITATVTGGRGGPLGFESERQTGASDLLAPLPNLRMSAFYAISSRWSMSGSTGWFSANIDEWDGRFLYFNARTDLMITDNLGISLGYQFTDVDVTRERRRQESEYDIEFKGPTLKLTWTF